MSEVYIHYGHLNNAVTHSQRTRSQIEGYVEELKRKVTTPISQLSGYDSAGYASTASSLAWQKINALNGKINNFRNFESSITSLVTTAKQKDNYVSSQIETIAGLYIQKRAWYQVAGDWLYDTFCVDLANKWDWTRGFADGIKWVNKKIGDGLEAVVDWFKYGDGKYILKITTAVVGAVAAVAGAVIAIVGIPFSGGATLPIVIGCIGAAAASIGAIITVVNSTTSVTQNAKALSLSGDLFDDDDGHRGAARYYGNTNKLSDYFKKNDMGDKKTNDAFETAGEIVDDVKVVADVTSFVCSVAKLGYVKDFRIANSTDPRAYKGYSFTWSNIKRNIMHDMGFKSNGKLDFKKAFDVKKSVFEKGYDKKFQWIRDGQKFTIDPKVVSFFKTFKITKNILDLNEDVGTVNEFLKYRDNPKQFDDYKDFFEGLSGITGNTKFFKPLDDYVIKAEKNGFSVYDMVTQ